MKANATIVGELLANGYIIAIFQGRAESGPRALGNRSILWNPQIQDGKSIINNLKKSINKKEEELLIYAIK